MIIIGDTAIRVTRDARWQYFSLFDHWQDIGREFTTRADLFHAAVGSPHGTRPPVEPWASHPAVEFVPRGRCHPLAIWCAAYLADYLPGKGWCVIHGEKHSNLISVRERLVLDPIIESLGYPPDAAISASRYRMRMRAGLCPSAVADAREWIHQRAG